MDFQRGGDPLAPPPSQNAAEITTISTDQFETVKLAPSHKLKRIKNQMSVRVRPKEPKYIHDSISEARIDSSIQNIPRPTMSARAVYFQSQKSEMLADDFYFHMGLSAISVFVVLSLLSLLILLIFKRR